MDRKTIIYLIRHGESIGNKENRVRGHMDFPLNENGIKQAEALAGALRGKGITRVYSSPLSRAVKTAEIISAGLGISYEIKEGFNNINLGVWENRFKSEIAAEFPKMWETWLNNPEELLVEGGESLDDVRERSLGELDLAVRENEGKIIAVVGHRGVLKPMIAGAIGMIKPSYWKIHFDTASYSTLMHSTIRGYCLTGLNYSEHLRDIPLIQEFD